MSYAVGMMLPIIIVIIVLIKLVNESLWENKFKNNKRDFVEMNLK